MLSGDNGLLKRAGQARDDTIVGEEKEQVELAYISAAVKKLGSNVKKDDLQEELNSSVGKDKTEVTENDNNNLNVYFIDTAHDYNVNNGTVTKIPDTIIKIIEFSIAGSSVEEKDIPIPTGFTHVNGTFKSSGYVIEDESHNQFVWVPVDKNQKISLKIKSTENITSIKLTDPVGNNIELGSISGKTYSNSDILPTINGGYKVEVQTANNSESKFLVVRSLYAIDTFKNEPLPRNTLSYYSETEDYAESVKRNGGFYIGRYESGKENNVLVVQANKTVWNNISQTNAISTAKTYNEKASLLTGAAWDRTLGWLVETNAKDITEISSDSTSWGNYKDDTFSETTGLISTGAFEQTKANNIYDLAGNVFEFTSQIYYSSTNVVNRGGNYYHASGSAEPASIRNSCSPSKTSPRHWI